MGKDGFYVFAKPERQVSETEARRLIRYLLTDHESDNPQVHWGYDPNRSCLSAFAGAGLNDGRYSVKICKEVIKGYTQVSLECCEGKFHCCTIVDLCYEPEQSELLRLHAQVAKTVHTEAMATRTLTAKRIIRFG